MSIWHEIRQFVSVILYNNENVIYSRVAVTPAVAATFIKKGFTVNIEKGAGVEAKFRDSDYASVGAKLVEKNDAFDSGLSLLLSCIVYFVVFTFNLKYQ